MPRLGFGMGWIMWRGVQPSPDIAAHQTSAQSPPSSHPAVCGRTHEEWWRMPMKRSRVNVVRFRQKWVAREPPGPSMLHARTHTHDEAGGAVRWTSHHQENEAEFNRHRNLHFHYYVRLLPNNNNLGVKHGLANNTVSNPIAPPKRGWSCPRLPTTTVIRCRSFEIHHTF